MPRVGDPAFVEDRVEDRLPVGASPRSVEAVVLGTSRAQVLPGHPDRVACVRAELRMLAARRRERDRRDTPAWKRKLTPAVLDWKYGHSLRGAAARRGVGVAGLYRELVEREVARRPAGKRSPRSPEPSPA